MTDEISVARRAEKELNCRVGRDILIPHPPPMAPKNPGKWGVAGCSVAK